MKTGEKKLRSLSLISLETLVEKGFGEIPFEEVPRACMMVVTEINEAISEGYDFDPHNKDAIGYEFADIAIRLLHILESLFEGWEFSLGQTSFHIKYDRLETYFLRLLADLCSAVEAWRDNHKDAVQMYLEYCLGQIFDLANHLDIDLLALVEKKIEINKKRPKLHGHTRQA